MKPTYTTVRVLDPISTQKITATDRIVLEWLGFKGRDVQDTTSGECRTFFVAHRGVDDVPMVQAADMVAFWAARDVAACSDSRDPDWLAELKDDLLPSRAESRAMASTHLVLLDFRGIDLLNRVLQSILNRQSNISQRRIRYDQPVPVPAENAWFEETVTVLPSHIQLSHRPLKSDPAVLNAAITPWTRQSAFQ